MINKNALKQVIVMIVLTLLFALNNGLAQTSNDEIRHLAFDDVADMVTEALLDKEVSIVFCRVPASGLYPASIYESDEKFRRHSKIKNDMMSSRIQVIEILRSGIDIDSVFYLSSTIALRDGKGAHLPSVYITSGSK